MATLLLNRLYPQKVAKELPVDFEVEVTIAADQTIKIEEKRYLLEEFSSFIQETKHEANLVDEVGSKILKKKMSLLEVTCARPKNLEKLFNN